MNLHKIIAELESERDRLDQAILALERLSTANAKRRGRPPRWLRDTVPVSPESVAMPEKNGDGSSP